MALIDGFRIIHSGVSSIEDFAGIKIYNRRNVVVQNNILEDTFFGIYTQYGINCVIRNNQLTALASKSRRAATASIAGKATACRSSATAYAATARIYFEFVTHGHLAEHFTG